MSIEHLHPFAGDHAIQSVLAVLEWSDNWPMQFGSQFISELKSKMVAKLEPLGFSAPPEDLTALELIMQQGAMAPQPTHSIGGFRLAMPRQRHSMEMADMARSVTFMRERCIIEISDYSRWSTVKQDIDKYIEILLTSLEMKISVKSITLQFNDIFQWHDDPSTLNQREIFRNNTKWLPPHVIELSDPWHSYHGYFDEKINPVKFKQLDNVNISRVIINQQHALHAIIAHRADFLEKPQWVDVAYSSNVAVSKIIDGFHSDNKKILQELFTDDVLARIKINV